MPALPSSEGHPWQRGMNENSNGLLRKYFPKSRDLSGKSDEFIQAVADKINKNREKLSPAKKRKFYRYLYDASKTIFLFSCAFCFVCALFVTEAILS